jgi:hypothetical protein
MIIMPTAASSTRITYSPPDEDRPPISSTDISRASVAASRITILKTTASPSTAQNPARSPVPGPPATGRSRGAASSAATPRKALSLSPFDGQRLSSRVTSSAAASTSSSAPQASRMSIIALPPCQCPSVVS